MNCVSYTRIFPNPEKPLPSIEEQNKEIRLFSKTLSLSVDKRYTDRKRSEGSFDGFKKMKEDAVSRLFDCVVFYSFDVFGKNIFIIHDLLANLLLPAGIKFAFAKEDFYSGNVSEDEADRYIEAKYHEGIVKYRLSSLKTHLIERKYEKYGYVYGDSSEELIIDDKVAPVIREVFELAANGSKPAEIAKELTRRNIPTPTSYTRNRLDPSFIALSYDWLSSAVVDILRNELYCGIWKRSMIGKALLLSCPSIVDKELFDKVQCFLDNRRIGFKKAGFEEILFSRSVFDKETGAPLVAQIPRPQAGDMMRMAHKYETITDYPKYRIAVSQMITETRQFLSEEKACAARIQKEIHSAEGKRRRKELIDDLISDKKSIIGEMMDIAQLYLPIQLDGNATCEEKEMKMSELDRQMDLLEERLKNKNEKLSDIEKAVSDKNPWLQLYLTYDGRSVLDRAIIKKYTSRILCDRFERLEITPKEQSWKELVFRCLGVEKRHGT